MVPLFCGLRQRERQTADRHFKEKENFIMQKKNPTNIYCNNNENTLALANTHKLSHKIKY